MAAKNERLSEAFGTAWGAVCNPDDGIFAGRCIDGVSIRRFATLFERTWKPIREDAGEVELFLAGREILGAYFRGRLTCDTASLESGDSAGEVIEIGRMAQRAAHGPRHPVVQAIFRRLR